MREREINLMDAIIEILLHWRTIIVSMLIGGVLLGAFSFWQSIRSAQAQAMQIEELKEQVKEDGISIKDVIEEGLAEDTTDLESMLEEWLGNDSIDLGKELRDVLTEKQLNNVNYAIYYENMYQVEEEYQGQSILMKIDSNNTQVVEITFQITADTTERACDIEKVYESVIASAEMLTSLAETEDAPVAAVRDIFSLSSAKADMLKGSDTFKVTLYHYDAAACQALAQTVIDYVNQKHDEMTDKLGSHEITVVNQTLGAASSAHVFSLQRNYEADFLGLQSAAINTKNNFSDEEWYYYNLLTTGKVSGNPNDKKEKTEKDDTNKEDEESLLKIINEGVTITPHVSFKYVVLGMILFAFVYVFVIFMRYVWDNKLRATDELQEVYGVSPLGQIPNSKNGKKLLGFVDEWILALKYRNKRRFTQEEALKLAAVAVKMVADKNILDTVFLIGCNVKNQTMEACEKIKTLLNGEVEIQILDNVLYDAQTMERLGNAKGVVIVEKAASTLCTEISQEVELLRRHQIKILGGIVVE